MEKMNHNGSEKLPEAPEKLAEQEVVKIGKLIQDERLQIDEDKEHFTIHTNGRVQYIPKWKRILIDKGGQRGWIKIEDYLRGILRDLPED
ncbi:MAG: hypothetical protein ACKKL5_00075 [Candidatus Komeilibacteria bacterium]